MLRFRLNSIVAFPWAATVVAVLGGSAAAQLPGGPNNASPDEIATPVSAPVSAGRQAPCALSAPRGSAALPVRRIAYDTPRSASEMGANLGCLLTGSVRGGRWGIVVVSLTRGDTIFSRDADVHFLPASTQKLFTAALALDQLGAEHHFRTVVLHTGQVDSSGTLHGDLVLQGGGDPAFSNKFVERDAQAPVNVLADLVRGAGVFHVSGNLLADPFAFDGRLYPEGWRSSYRHSAYAARVSALSLNENVASVVVHPGESEDSAPALLDPPAQTMAVTSLVRTVPGSRGSSISVRRLNDNTFQAQGWIGERANPLRIPMVVDDPVSFTVGAFQSALLLSGVGMEGSVHVAPAPPDARVLAELRSPPLHTLVTAMNRESNNHYAELIFRNAGRGVEGLLAGSAESAASSLAHFMSAKVGADPREVYAVDGSGLSVLNRVTPRALVSLLSYAHRAPWGSVFHASLPVAGVSATLRDRMRSTPAHGNLHAKTGTTSEVISLSGYVTADNGELLAFAFLYNGTDRERARATIDLMGSALATFSRR